ncbi:MAG: DUF6444 domain-containing protein [Nostoc sp.]
MEKDLPLQLDREILGQLATEQLVDMIIEQAIAIEQLKTRVIELEIVIEKLKVSRDLDSTTSSKPPSGDILKKTENKLEDKPEGNEAPKRKPGGQPGHQGKTRKGFGRVDRFEILRPQVCKCCGQKEFSNEPIKIETQQVAQLVDRPIEIVEYQRYTCICSECGETQIADWSPDIVPGQDIGIRLQAFLGWINNYGHLPYEKQQELLWERTLRLAVTKRKVSGGSRSMERFQDTANLLTVIQTCRRQGRSVIDFFDQAIKAMVNPAVQAPSLIPQI